MADESWPSEIRLSPDKRTLTVSFGADRRYQIPAELLRVESPSAEVQGHSAAEKRLVAGKRDVRIVGIDPVGSYAVKLSFDDGHSTGIYSWTTLAEFGRDGSELMRAYEEKIAEAGVSRDR